MKNIFKIIIVVCILMTSCTNGKPETIIEPVQKNQAIMGDTIKRVEEKPDTAKTVEILPPINYAGKYKLYVTRFREFTISHSIELTQIADSVFGEYSITYSNLNKKLIANYQGEVKGIMAQTRDDVNTGTTLYIDMTDQKIDSANFKASSEAAYMIDKFLESKMLATRFSITKNTLENNYAGGEWDTWKRIE